MRIIDSQSIDHIAKYEFNDKPLHVVFTLDGNAYFLVHEVSDILGTKNSSNLFTGADERTKAKGVLTFNDGLNYQRYSLINLDGLMYFTYRVKKSNVNRLDFVNFCKRIRGSY